MIENIQIFACDHRKNAEWNLPYIRFGGPESNCAIKISDNKIFDIEVNADETSKIFWLWQNINQFGNPDIIGYCQYRRFFSAFMSQFPVINLSIANFQPQFALTPFQQLMLINKNNVDGILHPAFKVIDDSKNSYKYIWEQIYILTKEDMLQLDFQKKAFDLFLTYTPNNLKNAMSEAYKVKENYLCNIFTVKTSLFKEFGEIAFKALKDLLNIIPKNQREKCHPYWLAYLFERYTSCWYHALEISGKYKFLKIPLLTIDGQNHIIWKKQNNDI